jgi:DNA-directed RNA polymerase specialized sigma24 family protein
MSATPYLMDRERPVALSSTAATASCASAESIHVDGVDPEDGLIAAEQEPRAAFQQKLREIQEDPEVRSLARRRAGDPTLAEDALQEAYCAVAWVKRPELIEDLRRYFCRVLINEVKHLRSQSRPALVEDFESLAEAHQDEVGCLPARPPVDETVCTSMVRRAWLERFSAQQAHLAACVPGRSSHPQRYRSVIVVTAWLVLFAILSGDVSDADSDEALRTAYPEWFAEEGSTPDNLYQRFSRARTDVRALLKIVIKRDELR